MGVLKLYFPIKQPKNFLKKVLLNKVFDFGNLHGRFKLNLIEKIIVRRLCKHFTSWKYK